MRLLTLALCGAIMTLPQSVAQAQGHGAHVHGEAQAAVIIENGSMTVTLTSAMYNITGFERAPGNDAEAAQLADAIAILERADAIIVASSAAACTSTRVEHSLPTGPALESAHDGHNPYRDLEATYTFNCSSSDGLTELRFELFESFDALEALDVVVLRGSAQMADTLTPNNTTLDLESF